jgi:hypothetical protein
MPRVKTQAFFLALTLICEGVSFQKTENFVAEGTVGLDLNISSAASYKKNNKID